MNERLSQQQQLKQQQRLTPLQVQFVRMLEMTGPEVEAEVARSLDEMPALEIAEADRAPAEAADDGEATFTESSDQVQLADYAGDDDTPSYMLEARNYSPDDRRYEPVAVNDEMSLAESLMQQLSEQGISADDARIASYVIGNLDSNGYLKRSPALIADDMAIQQAIDVSENQVGEVWQMVRALDPAGVGATDLRDCLLLQLRRLDSSPEVVLAIEIVDHHFDRFTKKHYDVLASRLGVDQPLLSRAIAIISHLNPKPGNQQGDTAIEQSARQIVPEFLVETEGDDLTVTLLNNIPELTVSQTFSDETIPENIPPRQRTDAITFLHARRDEASNFIKTLGMRQSTLFNVMSAIVSIQRDFFLTGDETKLRPMILKDIAELTGYDLSVISRATASRYVMTQSGLYPLKFFFNERPKADDDTTFHQIAAAIKAIVDAEDKDSPLSDESITLMLAARGLNVARRTVAKYRERIGLPVARLRRRLPSNPDSQN